MGGALGRAGGAGEAPPGAQGGSGALKRKTRSFGYSDGGQDEHAEGSTRRLSEADLPGVKRAGGAEDEGNVGTRTKVAQADQVGR